MPNIDQRSDTTLLADIQVCNRADDFNGFEALLPVVLNRPAPIRVALADAWVCSIEQVRMDIMAGKIAASVGYELSIDGYAACRRLCPDDSSYARDEAECRIDRAIEDETTVEQADDDLASALAIVRALVATDPRDQRAHRLLGRALMRHACLHPDAEAASAVAAGCVSLRTALSIFVGDDALWAWWRGITELAASPDQGLRG